MRAAPWSSQAFRTPPAIEKRKISACRSRLASPGSCTPTSENHPGSVDQPAQPSSPQQPSPSRPLTLDGSAV